MRRLYRVALREWENFERRGLSVQQQTLIETDADDVEEAPLPIPRRCPLPSP